VKILFLSHSHQGPYFRVGSHHLARELGALGHTVLHLSTPTSLVHDIRRLFRGRDSVLGRNGILVEGNVTHSTYKTLIPVAWTHGRRAFSKELARTGMESPDLVLIDQPLMGLAGSFSTSCMIYRPTDIHPEGAKRRRELQLIPYVDAVVATSQVVLDSLPGLDGLPTMILENGVEARRFAPGPTPAARAGAIYVGAVDHRFDWEAVSSIARSVYPEPVTICGPLPPQIPATELNVILAGPVEYESIPSLLAGARIGLLPFNGHDLNSSRSPMKFYEYLAAGLYILGRSTDPLRRRAAPGVFLYESEAEIQSLVKQIPGADQYNSDGQLRSLEYDWAERAKDLLKFVQLTQGVS
jgi:teichuronic acid biosynthesis glycosyltransferase TuaH